MKMKTFSKRLIRKIVDSINENFDFDEGFGILVKDFKRIAKWSGQECKNPQYALVQVRYKNRDWIMYVVLTAASDPVTDVGPYFIVSIRVFRDVTLNDASVDDDIRYWAGEPGIKLTKSPSMRYEIIIGAKKNESVLIRLLEKLSNGNKVVWDKNKVGRFNKTIIV